MENEQITSDGILAVATVLFRAKGYHETSINDIAKACKISVPCLYQYFLDKEVIAIAVMSRVQMQFERYVFKFAYDEELKPNERLANLNSAVERFFSVENSGCVFVNFVIETLNCVPAFEGAINYYFLSFSNAYKAILLDAYDTSTAQSLADDFVSDLQGALIMTRVTGTTFPLRRLSARLFQALSSNRISIA